MKPDKDGYIYKHDPVYPWIIWGTFVGIPKITMKEACSQCVKYCPASDYKTGGYHV